MFELLLVVGIGAIVVCMLKGRVWRGAVGLGLGALAVVAGYVLSDTLDSAIPAILANTGFAVGAVLLATPAAEPGSPWIRAGSVDAQGGRRIDAEPMPRRPARTMATRRASGSAWAIFSAIALSTSSPGSAASAASASAASSSSASVAACNNTGTAEASPS